MTYFTAVVDDAGKVETFADVYGLDSKLARRCSATPPDSRCRRPSRPSGKRSRRTRRR